MWLENEGCHDIMVGAWNRASSGSLMETMVTKIEACQKSITQWSKHSFRNVSKVLSEKKKLLKEAEVATTRGKNVEVFLQLKSKMNDLLRLEEKMWQQRSHVHWMVSRDRNSKYFHNRASQ